MALVNTLGGGKSSLWFTCD